MRPCRDLRPFRGSFEAGQKDGFLRDQARSTDLGTCRSRVTHGASRRGYPRRVVPSWGVPLPKGRPRRSEVFAHTMRRGSMIPVSRRGPPPARVFRAAIWNDRPRTTRRSPGDGAESRACGLLARMLAGLLLALLQSMRSASTSHDLASRRLHACRDRLGQSTSRARSLSQLARLEESFARHGSPRDSLLVSVARACAVASRLRAGIG